MSSVNNISLYIPRVFANYTKDNIAEAFEKVFIGKVSKIDLVAKMCSDGKSYNSAYIHFEYWYDNVGAANFQQRVLDPNQEARLIYDEPWYWIVFENKTKKHTPGDRKPRINLGDLNEKLEKSSTMYESKDLEIEEEINHNIYIDGRYVKELERINNEAQCYIGRLHAEIANLKYEQARFNLPV
jgi:hypothetical protein